QFQVQERTALGFFRLANQAEVRLLRRAAAFLDVAVDAGADDVFPSALPAARARHDVIETQLGGRVLLAAVLALVVVAREYVAAIELHRLLGKLVVTEQTNYARHLDLAIDRTHPVVVLLPHI